MAAAPFVRTTQALGYVGFNGLGNTTPVFSPMSRIVVALVVIIIVGRIP